MIGTFVSLIAVAVLGVVVHESMHALASQYYGIRWRLSSYRTYGIPNPSIYTELRDHTPRTLRVVSLAPLVMLVPAAIVTVIVGPQTVFLEDSAVGNGVLMWVICSCPSPTDLTNAYHASDLTVLHGVWYGDHRNHRLVEGI